MSAGGGGDDDDRSEFRRALRDVKPLAPGSKRRPEPLPRLHPSPAELPAEPVRFVVERAGELLEGHAPSADRKLVARLRRGEPAPEAQVDLHGLDAAAAGAALGDALESAWRNGRRCLLVIHGRGLHSEGEAVLKERLPAWLAAPPHGPRILAFASAPPTLGGPGATAVLLRRKR